MPLVGTVDVAIWVTLRSILLDAWTHEPVPTNSGLFRPISIVAPEGCIANPTFPAPTIARFCAGNIIADTLMRALAPVLPEGVSAGVGNLKVVAYSGFSGGQHWVYMDIQEGQLRRPFRQGRARRRRHAVREHAQQPDRGHRVAFPAARDPVRAARGPRRARPVARRPRPMREIEFLDDAGYSLEGDGSDGSARALRRRGGTPGAVLLNRGTDGELELPSKFPYRKAAAGDRLCLIWPCGGGYGDPLERDRDAVQEDVKDGYVSRESARTHYGLEGTDEETHAHPRRRAGRGGGGDRGRDGGRQRVHHGRAGEPHQHKAVPKFVAPGPAFNAKANAGGKTIFIIPASSQVPFVSTIANHIRRIATPIGVKVTIWQNQGQPSQWVQGMNAAIAQSANAIVLLAGNDPAGLQPQIKAAKAKGIPTIVAHLYDQNQPSAPNVGRCRQHPVQDRRPADRRPGDRRHQGQGERARRHDQPGEVDGADGGRNPRGVPRSTARAAS